MVATTSSSRFGTPSQEKFHSLAPSYTRDADGILLFYDITSRDSFAALERVWIEKITEPRVDNPQLVVLLVGTKIDQFALRAVPAKDVADFVARHRLQGYAEVTSLRHSTIYNVTDSLAASIYAVKNRAKLSGAPPRTNIRTSQTQRTRCCGN